MAKRRGRKMAETDATSGTAAQAPATTFHPPIRPTHGQKVEKLLANRKLPPSDKARVQAAKERYLER
jgi:hypothetical protein